MSVVGMGGGNFRLARCNKMLQYRVRRRVASVPPVAQEPIVGLDQAPIV